MSDFACLTRHSFVFSTHIKNVEKVAFSQVQIGRCDAHKVVRRDALLQHDGLERVHCGAENKSIFLLKYFPFFFFPLFYFFSNWSNFSNDVEPR